MEYVAEWTRVVRPHLYQLLTLQSQSPVVAMIAGIRGGKTTIGADWTLQRIGEMEPGSTFLITAPDFPMVSRVILSTLLDGTGRPSEGWPAGRWPTCPGCQNVICPKECPKQGSFIGEHHVGERLLITRDKGVKILYLTGENPDKVRGIAPRHAWIDEITLCKKDLYLNTLGRLMDFEGRLLITGTPKMGGWFVQTIMDKLHQLPMTLATRECSCGTRLVESALPEKCLECEEPLVPGEPKEVLDRHFQNEDVEMFRFPTSANPGITLQARSRLSRNLPQRLREQELEGKFVDGELAIFGREDVALGLSLGSPHWGQHRDGHRHVVGLDPAGKGKDYWALVCICLTCRAVTDVWRTAKTPSYAVLYEKTTDFCEFYQAEHLLADETSMGSPILEEVINHLAKRRGLKRHKHMTYVEGYTFSKQSKYELLTYAAARLEEGIGLSGCEACLPLVNETRNYQLDDEDLETDCVMAFSLACWGQVMPRDAIPTAHVAGRNLRREPRPRIVRDWRV